MEHKKSVNIGSDTSRTQLYKTDLSSLSRSARQRFRWMEHFDKYRNARLTCRHFGISPDTFYLWKNRFSPENPTTLEDDFKTRKPHRLRISMQRIKNREIIRTLKNIAPKMGKIRITGVLKGTGRKISASTVGRILKANKRLTLGSK
jgi:putative transposase